MVNPTPYVARLAKRRAHKPGTLDDVRKVLWTALHDAETLMYEATDPELRLRCVHAVSQVAGQYSKLLETAEIAARLEAVEAKLAQLAHSNGHLKVGFG